ncbi:MULTISPECIES: DUF6543 domain-containing protein [unclassified Pseudomonas]|uniref:dermonecrotic toxin domain-containing protein n=1 Tax=unclassified Pseudomonas TaxID=196821 RepID=UPI002449D1AC|nr:MULTISPECIES: DUF6543 domain-containing protein [unclassified Pseudomonas]MDH0301542.1 NEL-type E3 ubiquitin ligase domain-containing protein [Pseudomonas sp. GD04091]MDH1985436.1 NEL-type E3 ubiquitin ligase domain-containing protein [Pseudomonas sp. GD03689]
MLDIDPPYHQQQILRSLPGWTQHLHPTQTARLLRRAHREHVKADGQFTDWFAQASSPRQASLRDAIRRRASSQAALSKALADLRGITEFSQPLLQARLGPDVALTQAQFRLQPFTSTLVQQFPDPDASHTLAAPPTWIDQPAGEATLTNLLEAALHNFEGMAAVGSLSTLQVSADDSTELAGLSTRQFVSHCRALDLGKRYQEHLQGIYAGSRKQQIQALWTQARRDELRVQAQIAHLRGLLSDHGHQALLQCCEHDAVPRYGAWPVAARTLSMLDTQLHDVLLLTPEGPQTPPYIAYLPFDDEHPVQEFANLLELGRHIRNRLLDPAWRKRFLEHVALKDRAQMASKLRARLFDNPHSGITPVEAPATAFGEAEQDMHTWQGQAPDTAQNSQPVRFPALAVHERNITFPLWPKLFNAHVQRLKDDARCIAVPTADIDAKALRERLAHWGEQGLTLLNVAAMFVPGLDVAMLAVGAGQIMSSIFHGFEAWSEGDNASAVVQLESLMANLGSVAVIGGATTLLKASGLVDMMESIQVGGDERLWHPQLEHYRSRAEIPPGQEPDGEGLLHFDGRHFVELDSHLHELRHDPQSDWRLVHPEDPQAYQPLLKGNGRGAWRLAHERPQDWSRTKLLRRLGPICKGLDDADLLAALDSTALQRGVLEQLHVDGGQPPVLLEEALWRLKLDATASDIIARTRAGSPLAAYKQFAASVLGELPGWPQDVVLEVFDGDQPVGSATRYGRDRPGDRVIRLTRSDLDNGDLARIVLEHLDDTEVGALLPGAVEPGQRQQALQTLMADHLQAKRSSLFDSLLASRPQPASATAQTIGKQFPTLSGRAAEELASHANGREGQAMLTGRLPLRIAEEARSLQARMRLDRAILGLYRDSLATADSQRIRDALRASHPQWTREQCYHGALADRSRAARIIGQVPPRQGFRSPLRLSDGRYGYPLSPGVFASRAERELHALYPGLTDRELRSLLATLVDRGNIAEQIQALRTQLNVLRQHLAEWAQAGANRWGEQIGSHYRRAADLLARAWQGLEGETLRLSDLTLETLPSLPARLDHITGLTLDTVNTTQIPADLLQAFPSLQRLVIHNSPQIGMASLFRALRDAPALQELRLTSNGLEQLPAEASERLPQLQHLQRLSLRYNDLTLTRADLNMLTGLHLSTLDLHGNQIALDAETAALFSNMRTLRQLHLSDNPLGVSPDLSGLGNLAVLRLESCQLQHWPAGLTELMQRNPSALREIDLSLNDIEQLPPLGQIMRSPYVEGVRTRRAHHRWRFDYNPLDDATRQRLQRAGVVVEPPPEAVAPAQPLQRVDWLNLASEPQRATWTMLFAEDQHSALRQVLEQVGMSRGALRSPRAFASQVWTLLERAAANSELRQRLEQVAAEFPATCGDAGADGFGTLQIEVMAYDETEGAEKTTSPLFNFFRRLFRRDQVNELAQALFNARQARREALQVHDAWSALPLGQRGAEPAVPSLHSSDDIADDVLRSGLGQGLDLVEVRLALRTNLATTLDFPEPQQDMLYRDTADISWRTEEAIAQEVEALDESPEARRRWVSRHPTWRRLLRNEFPARFAALRTRWDLGVDYLEFCFTAADTPAAPEPAVLGSLQRVLGESPLDEQGQPRRLTITEGQYITGMNRMAVGLEEDEDALCLQLTVRRDPNN